jgi:MFS family permease
MFPTPHAMEKPPVDDLFNPYAAPKAEVRVGPHAGDDDGVWRDGAVLVMTKYAKLPDRCLKCNGPADGWALKRSLSWHPQVYYLLLLISPIIYIIVALIVRKTAKVYFPLCERHRRRRRRAIAVGWLASLLGIALIFAAATVVPTIVEVQTHWIIVPVVFFVGVVLFLTGIIYGFIRSQVAVPTRIDKRFVWLNKVGPAFLATLPFWR